jgi:hypothetical protein
MLTAICSLRLTCRNGNLRLVLAWLRMILRVVLLALLQIFAIQPALKPAENWDVIFAKKKKR